MTPFAVANDFADHGSPVSRCRTRPASWRAAGASGANTVTSSTDESVIPSSVPPVRTTRM